LSSLSILLPTAWLPFCYSTNQETEVITIDTDRATVLIVDDDPGPREALGLVLEQDFDVLFAQNGREALGILSKSPVDVVTLDLQMPGLSGEQTLALLREIDPVVPVIIVTGHSSLQSAIAALRMRAFDYISKPFDARKVRALVKEAVEERAGTADRALTLLEPAESILKDAEELVALTSRLPERDRAKLVKIRLNALALVEGLRRPAGKPVTSLAVGYAERPLT
jgi:DNA-binding NtrC family response regulator